MSYIGHGGLDRFGDGGLLTVDDEPSLRAPNVWVAPLMLLACVIAYRSTHRRCSRAA